MKIEKKNGLKMASSEWSALALTVCCALLSASRTSTCPTVCTCRWKSGKETAVCADQGLVSVPPDLDGGTQVLDLSHNPLRTLGARTFVDVKLLNLQRIFLSHCRLATLHPTSFARLANLVELDLSHNSLARVPSDAFAHFPDLRRLSLAGNPIEALEADAFTRLRALTSLELSECRIERIDHAAFRGLGHLARLKLDANRLSRIDGAALAHLRALHAVELQRNPWQCDCHLLNLYAWLTARPMHSSSPVRCERPRQLEGRALRQLAAERLACAPSGSYVSRQARVTEGQDARLSCRITANPEPSVQWVWRDRVIDNHTFAFAAPQTFVIHESGTTNKTSALTIVRATRQNAGRYECVGRNPAGQFTATTNLLVVTGEGAGGGGGGGWGRGRRGSGVHAGHALAIFAATTLVTTAGLTVCFLLVKRAYLRDRVYGKVLVECEHRNEEKEVADDDDDDDNEEAKPLNSNCRADVDERRDVTLVVNDIRLSCTNNDVDSAKSNRRTLEHKIANAIRTRSPTPSDENNKVQLDHVTVESRWKRRNTSVTSKFDNESSNEWLPAEIESAAYESPKFSRDKLWPLCDFPSARNNANICVYNGKNNSRFDLECVTDAAPKRTNSDFAAFFRDVRETDL